MSSNYPPGVSGNEPQIAGYSSLEEKHFEEHPDCNDPDCEFHHPEVREDFNDNFNSDEILMYLVCQDCGEAFQATTEGIMAAQAHEGKIDDEGCYGSCYMLQTEEEAM